VKFPKKVENSSVVPAGSNSEINPVLFPGKGGRDWRGFTGKLRIGGGA
jgi:hypothetical protein